MPRFASFFALIAMLALTTPALADTGPDPTRIEITAGGLPRSFLLTIPDGLRAPAPLVVALHGVIESGPMFHRDTRGRFEVLARKHGFVVAYPSAFARVWVVGEGVGAARMLPRRDDTAFVRRVIDEVSARVPIDPDRVFLAGFSQGAILSYAVACKNPGLIRAMAAVAMPLPDLFADDCAAHPPGGVLLVHGSDDKIVPIEGGEVLSGLAASMHLLSHRASAAFFAEHLGCSGPDRIRQIDEKADGTRVTRTDWTRCRRGPVTAYRIDGGGHTWPSGGPDLPFVGTATREFDGASAVWSFFARFN